jgi:hypothetical protein
MVRREEEKRRRGEEEKSEGLEYSGYLRIY